MAQKASVNISTASSGKGLRDDLDRIARGRGLSRSKLVEKFLLYAVAHKSKFAGSVKNPRPKPGEHISTTVAPNLLKKLNAWAEANETTRSLLTCFLIEKLLELELIEKVFEFKPERSNDDDDEDDR